MIDKFTIMFSTLMTFYVILRAAKLDRLLPWFETKWLYEQAQKTAAAAKAAKAAVKDGTALRGISQIAGRGRAARR
jgi:hypothetical protein